MVSEATALTRVDRRLALISLVLLTMIVAVLARPLADLPWHSPDAHSSLPHRAYASGLAADPAGGRVPAGLVLPEQRAPAANESAHQPGRLEPEPPELPPRS